MTSVPLCGSCFLRNSSPYSCLQRGKRIIWLLLLIRRVRRLTFDFLLHSRRLLSAGGGSSPTATNTRCSSAELRDPHTLRNTGPPQSTIIGDCDRREQWTCVCAARPGGPSHPGRAGGNSADGGQRSTLTSVSSCYSKSPPTRPWITCLFISNLQKGSPPLTRTCAKKLFWRSWKMWCPQGARRVQTPTVTDNC